MATVETPIKISKILTDEDKKKRNLLIAQGLPEIEIARQCHVYPNAIRYYRKKTGQEEFYAEKRMEREGREGNNHSIGKEKRKVLETIVAQINQHAESQVKPEEKWAYEKTQEYFKRTKVCALPFNQVFEVFLGYDEAVKKEEKVSLTKLAKRAGLLWQSTVSNVLKRVGLAPFYECVRRPLKPEYKRALERAAKLDYLSYSDIACLTGLKWPVVREYYKRTGLRPGNLCKQHFIADLGNGNRLSNRIASEVYQAKDGGLSNEEAAEYAGVSEDVSFCALVLRPAIEPVLKNALREMYPDKEITKPYKNFT